MFGVGGTTIIMVPKITQTQREILAGTRSGHEHLLTKLPIKKKQIASSGKTHIPSFPELEAEVFHDSAAMGCHVKINHINQVRW